MEEQPNTLYHFIGLGGAGCNVLEGIYAKGIQAKYTCISNPERPNLPDRVRFLKFIPPRQENYSIDRLSTGLSDMNMPLTLSKEVKEVFTGNDRYILLTGLGGYTGTKMVEQLIPWLQEHKKDFMVICNMPFAFEGERRICASTIIDQFQILPNFNYFDLESVRKKVWQSYR